MTINKISLRVRFFNNEERFSLIKVTGCLRRIRLFKELDVIKAKRKLSPFVGYGTLGAIVFIHGGNHYEVEFVDDEGQTLDLLTVNKDDIELLK
jgi:hypothetical protein